IDARQRFLRSSGRIIPRGLELYLVPAEVPELYAREVDFWCEDLHGVDYSPLREFAVNNPLKAPLNEKAFLAQPVRLLHIDLATHPGPAVGGEAITTASRSGEMHGLAGWFSAELADGVYTSNGPVAGRADWPLIFLPVRQVVSLNKGDSVRARLATYNGSEWRWSVDVIRCLETTPCVHFTQSTIDGFPLSLAQLQSMEAGRVPELSRRGEAEARILSLLAARRSIGEIAQHLLDGYGDVFQRRGDAASLVREVVARCAVR
ncbi:MAG TPA: hypothetical protein VFM88_01240, partial [Vicinamibacteria bacterium]|nr:hypothetical protein [Vicinamibacteria bacterium]